MSIMSFAKLFTKPLTPVATLAGSIAASQLANVMYYNLGSAFLASTLIWAFQFMLCLTLIGTGGYLIFGSDDE